MTVAFVQTDMTLTDLLIIYLAFGAPLAVYKYLQNRGAEIGRRILVSSFTFVFWLPAAAEIGYLYFTNAYFGGAFVSRRDLVSADEKLSAIRESLSTELIKCARGSSIHDLRETIDRYVGLAGAAKNSVGQAATENELFQAAGREKDQLSSICLMRRNLHRLERHHIQASADFVGLFEGSSNRPNASASLDSGIEMARQLDDHDTVRKLGALKVKRGEVWNSEQLEQHQPMAAVPSMPMTPSLNSD
jgi:hypothetical protein